MSLVVIVIFVYQKKRTMFELKFSDNIPRHKCVGAREGDFLIFKCTECDYVRTINTKTGKSSTINSSLEILHEGTLIQTNDSITKNICNN